MPRKDGSLTRTEQQFLAVYAETGDREIAEKKAGIAPRTGYAMLSRPEIQRRIIAEQTARLTADGLPVAVKTLLDVMQSSKAPAAARVQAARYVVDRALGPLGAEGGAAKELHEMTPEELSAAIAALERQASELAKPVEAKPAEGDVFE